MNTNVLAFGSVLTLMVTALLVYMVQTCGEYQLKSLDVQKACLQAGHSPIECGVVRVHN
jgi:hypothetical protein